MLLIEKFFVLLEMTFGLVHASHNLPEWQAVKLTFLHPDGSFTGGINMV